MRLLTPLLDGLAHQSAGTGRNIIGKTKAESFECARHTLVSLSPVVHSVWKPVNMVKGILRRSPLLIQQHKFNTYISLTLGSSIRVSRISKEIVGQDLQLVSLTC
jgi:hypothetical protein